MSPRSIWGRISILFGLALALLSEVVAASDAGSPPARIWTVALVQFDSVPEQAERNLREMERLARQAAGPRGILGEEKGTGAILFGPRFAILFFLLLARG